MKICPKCKSEHDKSGLYCSRKCANSRSFSEETKEKKRKKTKQAWKDGVYEESRMLLNYKQAGEKSQKTWNKKLLEEDFRNLKFGRLRKRIILEQDGKCNKCGLSEWQEEKLSLELEHKDGNHNNNERENLECLCPNCHSLTKTWRGRNCKKKNVKVSDEIIIKTMIKNNNNIRQTLIEVGLTPKGGNYKRINKIMKMVL